MFEIEKERARQEWLADDGDGNDSGDALRKLVFALCAALLRFGIDRSRQVKLQRESPNPEEVPAADQDHVDAAFRQLMDGLDL